MPEAQVAQGLESLLPEYQAQYTALMPEIERKLRADLVRRGMRFSGTAGEELTRAQAALLAELAGKSEQSRLSQAESARERQHQATQAEAARREQARQTRLALIGSGVGGLATLGGMYAMRPRPEAAANLFQLQDGSFASFDPASGTMKPVPMAGGGAAGGGTELAAGAPGAGVGGAVNPAAPAAPSMWQRVKQPGFSGYAGAAAGGFAGQQLARLVGGGGGTGTDVGAGLGGLGGLMAARRLGGTSPWALGLGALAGSFGGGLLGNLFK